MRALIGDVLLWVGVGLAIVSCLGVLVMRDVYDRLHYTGPAILGAVFVAAAICVRDGMSLVANKALLTAAFLLVTGPVLTHATARAARDAERGSWKDGIGDEIEVEER